MIVVALTNGWTPTLTVDGVNVEQGDRDGMWTRVLEANVLPLLQAVKIAQRGDVSITFDDTEGALVPSSVTCPAGTFTVDGFDDVRERFV